MSNQSLSSLTKITNKKQLDEEVKIRISSVIDKTSMLQVRSNSIAPSDSISNIFPVEQTPPMSRPPMAPIAVVGDEEKNKKGKPKSGPGSWITLSTKHTNATSNKSQILENATKANITEISMQLAIVLIPLTIILTLSGLALYQAWQAKVQKETMRDTILDAIEVNELLHLVIQEEEAVCNYVNALTHNSNMLRADERFRQSTVNTDSGVEMVAQNWDASYMGSLDALRDALANARTNALKTTHCNEAVRHYRAVDHPLTSAVVHHFGNTESARICQYLTSFESFIEAQDAFSSVVTVGLSYFYGHAMSLVELAKYHEDRGRANALLDAALNPVSDITFADVQDVDEWQDAFAHEQPEYNAKWKDLENVILHQSDVNVSDVKTWKNVTDSLHEFLNEAEERIHSHVNSRLEAAVTFQLTEMQILYALFLRRQRLQIVKVAARVRQQSKAIAGEKNKTTLLLNHMLPKHVVDALRSGNTVVPESYQSVSILFAEITGFTALVHSADPQQVVNILNAYYTSIDDVLEMHNCYKVEIVNDAVLISSGVPNRCGSRHSDELASAALDILMSVTKNELPHVPGEHLLLKMGIHTGPCSSGVLGSNKPKFCLFGDAVNTSSRMMSTSQPMCIHISQDTHEHLNTNAAGLYVFQERGRRHVKGKGLMPTYWVLGKRDHPYTISIKEAEKTTENTTYYKRTVNNNKPMEDLLA